MWSTKAPQNRKKGALGRSRHPRKVRGIHFFPLAHFLLVGTLALPLNLWFCRRELNKLATLIFIKSITALEIDPNQFRTPNHWFQSKFLFWFLTFEQIFSPMDQRDFFRFTHTDTQKEREIAQWFHFNRVWFDLDRLGLD